jgi:hypothetical protein
MVTGIPELKRRFGRIPEALQAQLRPELAKAAAKIVQTMNALKPIPEIQIEWTWGPPPSGTVSLGTVAGSDKDREFISIYTNAFTTEYPGGFPAISRWFEFGTFERFQDTTGRATGSIVAQPYFFPAYRANKNQVRLAIGRKVRQAVKSL